MSRLSTLEESLDKQDLSRNFFRLKRLYPFGVRFDKDAKTLEDSFNKLTLPQTKEIHSPIDLIKMSRPHLKRVWTSGTHSQSFSDSKD